MEYNGRLAAYKCTTEKEGHVYTGYSEMEDGVEWYEVLDDNEMPYLTRETPVHYMDLTLYRVADGTPEPEAMRQLAYLTRRTNPKLFSGPCLCPSNS